MYLQWHFTLAAWDEGERVYVNQKLELRYLSSCLQAGSYLAHLYIKISPDEAFQINKLSYDLLDNSFQLFSYIADCIAHHPEKV